MSLSRGKIIGTTLKWLVILMGCAILLRIACIAIYMSMGMNPMEMTKFGGDPTHYKGMDPWRAFLRLLVIAPLAEEVMFRLGLSFKRRTVALWLGLLPIVCALYMWKEWRRKYIIPAMWISAISFGLMHLRAFSVLNGQVFPFALATILVPMAGGCAITYARVNLGFWWGVLLHCIINIPGVLMIVANVV